MLIEKFGFKTKLVMGGEHAFYHALCKLVPGLHVSERVLDADVLSKCVGKQKSISNPRPDYFHFFGDGTLNVAIHGEYDETEGHEDCDERLAAIAQAADVPYPYVFRVMARHYTDRALCARRVLNKTTTYYALTDKGRRVAEETAVAVRERLQWISQGLGPDDAAGRMRKIYINY